MNHLSHLRTALAVIGGLGALLSNIEAAPPDARTDYIDTTYT